MVDLVTNRNCLYQTAYHVIWCPKYRGDALTGPIAAEVGTLLEAICGERGWPVISKEVQPDHIHLRVSIPPALAVANAATALTGPTPPHLLARFPPPHEPSWPRHF